MRDTKHLDRRQHASNFRANICQVLWGRLKEHPLSKLGPGLITGVADDDPSGIATYSQAGAQFGLNMLWTMPLTFPLMAAVQSMCENLGRVTGKGLAANIKTAFSPAVLKSVVLLLLIANTLNIAADVAAMGEVAELVSGINTAAQAASTLRPLAGDFAYLLFALGILGVGMIGVPVLAGSGAYALCETMGWHEGLERKVRNARGFYSIIAISVLAALAIQYSPISPMKALFWSAVINGVVAVPLMVVIIILVSKKSVMGDFTVSRPLIILGWVATAVMGAAAMAMFIPG
ncbi:NRAMP family divalent metal transporter [Pseudomonas fluorescens]|uniref:NRAMP family divalent metal transporter n=1 Tax=Pseudomonas fluorescens TaxID=294 RepID=UPI003D08FCE6